MGIRSRLAEERADLLAGFDAAEDDAHDVDGGISSIGELPFTLPLGFSRVALYGFLLAFPGVPFLPWGQGVHTVWAVMAAALGSVPLGKRQLWQLMRIAAIAVLVVATMYTDPVPGTSIVLIGALLSSAAATAKNFPFVYGLVAGGALGALLVRIFGVSIHASQSLLSGKPWTTERASNDVLHFAGFMFLAGLLHFGRFEVERMHTRAKAAEAARDAAVADERARIARELHDVVSHHVTAMTLQAEAAAMTGDKTALTAVASQGREALTELRRMLGVLRRPDDAPAAKDPQPGVGQLDELATRTTSGLKVRIERRGAVRPLSAGLELGVYRVVQESLTNTAKHSDASTVDVVLTYGESDLVVDVTDDGRPLVAARVGSGGLGLVGMGERVALLNGELVTGPRDDGNGYRVHARLPIDE
jgi:signal transduction histidine kinase